MESPAAAACWPCDWPPDWSLESLGVSVLGVCGLCASCEDCCCVGPCLLALLALSPLLRRPRLLFLLLKLLPLLRRPLLARLRHRLPCRPRVERLLHLLRLPRWRLLWARVAQRDVQRRVRVLLPRRPLPLLLLRGRARLLLRHSRVPRPGVAQHGGRRRRRVAVEPRARPQAALGERAALLLRRRRVHHQRRRHRRRRRLAPTAGAPAAGAAVAAAAAPSVGASAARSSGHVSYHRRPPPAL